MSIKVVKVDKLKEKPDQAHLGFGKYFTDYMLVMDYKNGKWLDPEIVPYGPIAMDPATLVLHYGLETFEGMKAYHTEKGITLFRPDMNAARINRSNARLCMPEIPEDLFVKCVATLVNHEKSWVPTLENTSLYIRPFVFATEVYVGVHPSTEYKFVVILTPVGAYYKEGMNPVKIYIEDYYVRAVVGGTGFTKCGGNYAASIIGQQKAIDLGCTQVLWLDGVHHKYIEEVGTMNVMFVVDGKILTPALNGSILPGITRDSSIKLLKSFGYTVEETAIDVNDLIKWTKNGQLTEAFGTGTAAVISPIGEWLYHDEHLSINNGKIGPIAQRLYDTITAIQYARHEDEFGWIKFVEDLL